MNKQKSTTRSIERALEIFDCFLEDDSELSLNEISEKVKLAPSTVYRIVNTLVENSYLSKNNDKKYSLGRKVALIGSRCYELQYKHIKEVALPFMKRLNEKYNESISLYVVDDDNILCIERIETTRSVRQVLTVGDYLPLTAGASGKLLLAYEPKKHRDRLIDDNLFLKSAIEKIIEQGYAYSFGEKEEGLSCISAPIIDGDKTVVAAITITGLSVRFQGQDLEEKKSDTVVIAKEISKALRYKAD